MQTIFDLYPDNVQITRRKSIIVPVRAMTVHRGSESMAPLILNLESRRGRMVILITRPLLRREEIHRNE